MVSKSWKTEVLKTIKSIYHNLQCGICLEFLEDAVMTKCKHLFCKKCIMTVFDGNYKASCPICKTEFTKRSMTSMKHLSELTKVINKLEGTFLICLEHKPVDTKTKAEPDKSFEIITEEKTADQISEKPMNASFGQSKKRTKPNEDISKKKIETTGESFNNQNKPNISEAIVTKQMSDKTKQPLQVNNSKVAAHKKPKDQQRKTFDFDINTEDLPGASDMVQGLEQKLGEIKGQAKKVSPKKSLGKKKLGRSSLLGKKLSPILERNQSEENLHSEKQNTTAAQSVWLDPYKEKSKGTFEECTIFDLLTDFEVRPANKLPSQPSTDQNTVVLPPHGGKFSCLSCQANYSVVLKDSQILIALDTSGHPPSAPNVDKCLTSDNLATQIESALSCREEDSVDRMDQSLSGSSQKEDDNTLDISSPLIFPTIPEEQHSPTDPALIYANTVVGPLLEMAKSAGRVSKSEETLGTRKKNNKRKYSRIKVTDDSSSDSDAPLKMARISTQSEPNLRNQSPDLRHKSDAIRQEIADMKKRIKNMETFLQNEEESNDEDMLYPPSD